MSSTEDSEPESAVPYFAVQNLSRFAPDLPETYREAIDQPLCEEIAESFAEHIKEYAEGVGAAVVVSVDLSSPPSVEVARDGGGSIDVSFFGDEAFDLMFWPAAGSPSAEDFLKLGESWPGLDRSGVGFLSHMFVETGKLEVPTAGSTELDLS